MGHTGLSEYVGIPPKSPWLRIILSFICWPFGGYTGLNFRHTQIVLLAVSQVVSGDASHCIPIKWLNKRRLHMNI